MKQILASIGIGIFVCAVWICIIVFASQGLGDESQNSLWVEPLAWWDTVLSRSGISLFLKSLEPTAGRAGYLVLGSFVIFAPFIGLFSFISFFVLRLINPKRSQEPQS